MEASEGVIRGNVDSLMKLVAALDALGVELISDNAASQSGGAWRAAQEGGHVTLMIILCCAAALLALSPLAVVIGRSAMRLIYGASVVASAIRFAAALAHLLAAAPPENIALPLGLPWLGAHLRIRFALRFLPGRGRPSARSAQACSRSATAGTKLRRSACCRSIRLSSPP